MALPCEFYLRPLPGFGSVTQVQEASGNGPLVDIAQVAHVVTTMSDFRADYGEDSKKVRLVNLWDDRSLALGLESGSDKSSGSSSGSDKGPSTADTEPEEIMSPICSRADRITELSCEDSDDDLSSLASSLVPRHRPGELKRAKTPEIIFPNAKKNANGRGKGSDKSDRKELNFKNLPVPPPSSQNGSIIFSAVFSQQRDWSWSAKFLLGIHEPIRHALFVMDRFLEQSQSQSKPEASHTLALESHVAEFFLWFKTYFVEYLLCQHEVKAAVLLPMLNLPVSTKQQILDVYQDIKQMLAQIQQLERALCVSGLAVLPRGFCGFNIPKPHHASSIPRHPGQTRRGAVDCRAQQDLGGETEQRSIQGMLPFSAKFMYRKIWRPYFMSNVAVAMKNLNEFVCSADSNSSAIDARQVERQHPRQQLRRRFSIALHVLGCASNCMDWICWSGAKTFDGMDFAGEVMANFLGLNQSKYQWIIDAQAREEEDKQQRQLERRQRRQLRLEQLLEAEQRKLQELEIGAREQDSALINTSTTV
ncbi:FAM177 family [Phytophthora cactorum]|nr:FAM177 family [Phytophthora cactorum]